VTRSLAVVVPNYNGVPILPSCLEALRRQTQAPATVVVVDNGSTDGSVELLERDFPEVTVLSRGFNSGFGGAANLGVDAVSTQLVAVLNSDARPAPNWVEELTAFDHEGVWSWGGLLLSPSGRVESAGDCFSPYGSTYKHAQGRLPADLPSEPYEVMTPPGAAPVFVREVFLSLGGYDERYFLYVEDIDLALRARARGYTSWVLPSTSVEHDLGGSGTNAIVTWHSARNSLWCYLTHMPRLSPRAICATTLREWRAARRRSAGWAYARGRLAVVRDLPRLLRLRRVERRARTISDDAVLHSLGLPGALEP
jgi:GT2 family glycosyltransferase